MLLAELWEQIFPREKHIMKVVWGCESVLWCLLKSCCVVCRGPGDSGGVPAEGGQRLCVPQCLDALCRRLPLRTWRGGVNLFALYSCVAYNTPQVAELSVPSALCFPGAQ